MFYWLYNLGLITQSSTCFSNNFCFFNSTIIFPAASFSFRNTLLFQGLNTSFFVFSFVAIFVILLRLLPTATLPYRFRRREKWRLEWRYGSIEESANKEKENPVNLFGFCYKNNNTIDLSCMPFLSCHVNFDYFRVPFAEGYTKNAYNMHLCYGVLPKWLLTLYNACLLPASYSTKALKICVWYELFVHHPRSLLSWSWFSNVAI